MRGRNMKFKVLVLIFDTSLPITFVSLNTCVNWDARSREMKRSKFLILNYLITLCCIFVPFQKLSSFVLVIFFHFYR